MAKIFIIKGLTQRQKKWEHFKMKARWWVFKASILANLYFIYKLGYLEPIINFVNK